MKAMIGATIALTLLGSSAVFAQTAYRSQPQQIEVQNRNSAEPREQNGFGQNQERNDPAYRNNEIRDNPHWSRGDKLPTQYRANQYVVSDWKITIYDNRRAATIGFARTTNIFLPLWPVALSPTS